MSELELNFDWFFRGLGSVYLTAEQVGWMGIILAFVLFVVVFVSSGRADNKNRRRLKKWKRE